MSQGKYPRFKAAAAHAASVFLDSARSADKACDLIAEATRNGAELIVFPESFLPGFPVWAALQAPILSHDFFKAMAAQAVRLESPEIAKLREAARAHEAIISIGFTEGTSASVGCLWNSNLLLGPDGELLNHHRKLVPTFYEKLVWANGDGRGLRVVETGVGRLGMLICGENTNPLARFALMAQGEQIHMSSYPPIWPTRPANHKGAYNLRRAIEIRAGGHAFEAKVFNVVASGAVDTTLRQGMAHLDRSALDTLDNAPRAVSMILDPSGEVISDVLEDDEGITYAEIDVASCVEPKQFHDVVGYYNRFDIFHLDVDRSRKDAAVFTGHVASSEEIAAQVPSLAGERVQGVPSAMETGSANGRRRL
jgi:nitrilase